MSVFSSPVSPAWPRSPQWNRIAPTRPLTEPTLPATRKIPIPPTAEGRRLRALELKRDGWQQSEIAVALDVTPGAVSQWMRRAREQGAEGLRSRRDQSGARPRLTSEQWERVAQILSDNPETHGFDCADPDNPYWTVKDIAVFIEHTFGVHYHPSHVGRALKQRGIVRISE